MSKIPPPPLDTYRIISDAIERAIPAGLRKAEKRELLRGDSGAYLDAAAEIIHSYVMADLEEVVAWDQGGDAPDASLSRLRALAAEWASRCGAISDFYLGEEEGFHQCAQELRRVIGENPCDSED